MISVIILSWKRPNNIINNILPAITKYKLINEVIISHGNDDTYFLTPQFEMVKHFYDKELNDNTLGVARRFLRAADANNDCVLFIDDDRLVSEKYINKMYKKYCDDPFTIIGADKRYISLTFGYTESKKIVSTEIVLIGTTMSNKNICKKFMENCYIMTDYAKKSTPIWNGEDIFFSIILLTKYIKSPIYIPPEKEDIKELDNSFAISKNKDHYLYRKKFSRIAIIRTGLFYKEFLKIISPAD
jgi:hypothetical protein